MVRTPAPRIGRPTPIEPVATPVNTYVRPPDPAPSSLHGLAEGLAAFDSGLKGWLDKRKAEQDEADAVRGQAAFNRNNQSGWAAAVSSGQVPANASPVFMESYKTAEGNYKGIRMREAFTDAYTAWEGKDSDDPEVFSTFLSDFIAQNIDTEDPKVLEGFLPHVEALQEQAYKTHVETRSKAVYSGHVNTRAAIVGDIIDHASIQGVSSGEGTDYEALFADILQQREEALAAGIRTEDFDTQLAAAIAAKAIEHGDPYLLDLLDEQLPGYDVKFSSLPDYRDLKNTTIAALEVEARRRMTETAQAQKNADDAAEGRIVADVFTALSEDPLAIIPEEVIAQWSVYDPEARDKLAKARKTFMDEDNLEDPEDLIAIERLIQNGATEMDILDLAAEGVIKDPRTFQTLLDRAKRRQEDTSGILTSQTTKRFSTTIKERTAPDEIGAMFAPDGLTDEGIEATRDFESMLLDWAIKNPDASIYEQEQFIYQAGELILKRIDREDTSDPQYISQQDAEAMRAEEEAATKELVEGVTGVAEEVVNPPSQPSGPFSQSEGSVVGREFGSMVKNYEPETVNIYGGDAPPSVSEMDEATQSMLTQRAEAQGLTAEEYSLEIWKTVREGLGLSTEYTPPAPEPITAPNQSQANPDIFKLSNARSPEAASEALAYFQSNPQAVRIDPTQIVDMTPTTSGNWNFGKLSQPNALVIHHTAGRGGVDGVVQTFKERGYPAHFVIDRDGTIHRILADDQKGQHTRPAQDGSGITNSNSWGVEIIAKDDADLTPAQVQASIQLSYNLHDNYQMPLDRVVGHGQINDHKQETEGATVLAALSELAKGGNPNGNISEPAGLSPQRGVEPLLAFISQEEGTRQDYNITHRYGEFTGGDVDLVGMTLDQVLDLQSSMKAKGSSGAVGKYQMLPGTLQDAMRALGMDGNTKFDAQTQEALAMWLLERRGLNDWRSGKITTEAFVDNLAKEWASLATSSGKAHYAGQGQHASLEGLLAALNQTT